MKRITALLLLVVLAFSLVACSMSKDKGESEKVTKPDDSITTPANNNSDNNSGNNNSGNNNNNKSNNSTKPTENMLESMIPDISTNVSTEGQR